MRLKQIRKAKGMTQVQLAELLEVEQGEISKLESANRNPKLETLQKIASALEVEISDLFTDRSEHELFLVETFRSLPPDRQKGWLDMARLVRNEQDDS